MLYLWYPDFFSFFFLVGQSIEPLAENAQYELQIHSRSDYMYN